MDIADQASDREMADREFALAARRAARPAGHSTSHCLDCGEPIPEGRRKAVPGVRLCLPCQEAEDAEDAAFTGYNRRGSKDSQLR